MTVVGVLRKRWRPLVKDMRPDVELAITAEHVRVRNEERGADQVSMIPSHEPLTLVPIAARRRYLHPGPHPHLHPGVA